MSKSDAEGSYIALLDPPDVIRKKIARATTDSERTIVFDEKPPGYLQPADDLRIAERPEPRADRGRVRGQRLQGVQGGAGRPVSPRWSRSSGATPRSPPTRSISTTARRRSREGAPARRADPAHRQGAASASCRPVPYVEYTGKVSSRMSLLCHTGSGRADSSAAGDASVGRSLVPVWREIHADLETPVSAYLKLARATAIRLLARKRRGRRAARALLLRRRRSLSGAPRPRDGIAEYSWLRGERAGTVERAPAQTRSRPPGLSWNGVRWRACPACRASPAARSAISPTRPPRATSRRSRSPTRSAGPARSPLLLQRYPRSPSITRATARSCSPTPSLDADGDGDQAALCRGPRPPGRHAATSRKADCHASRRHARVRGRTAIPRRCQSSSAATRRESSAAYEPPSRASRNISARATVSRSSCRGASPGHSRLRPSPSIARCARSIPRPTCSTSRWATSPLLGASPETARTGRDGEVVHSSHRRHAPARRRSGRDAALKRELLRR